MSQTLSIVKGYLLNSIDWLYDYNSEIEGRDEKLEEIIKKLDETIDLLTKYQREGE